MSKMIPVEGHSNLYRDMNSGAIVNRDQMSYENYIATRRKNKEKEEQMDKMKNEIEELKSMLNDLASKINS